MATYGGPESPLKKGLKKKKSVITTDKAKAFTKETGGGGAIRSSDSSGAGGAGTSRGRLQSAVDAGATPPAPQSERQQAWAEATGALKDKFDPSKRISDKLEEKKKKYKTVKWASRLLAGGK